MFTVKFLLNLLLITTEIFVDEFSIKSSYSTILITAFCTFAASLFFIIKKVKMFCGLQLFSLFLKTQMAYFFWNAIGLGDYLPLSIAKEIILRNCRSPKKERLIYALELTNEKRGIHKAKAVLDAEKKAAKDSGDLDALLIAIKKADDFGKSLKDLNKMNINPMCLPLGISREYKTFSIPNLLRKYLSIKGIPEETMKIGVVNWPKPYFYSSIDI